MLSHLHETVLEMFRHRPALAPELLTGLGAVNVPAYREARLGAAEVTELRPAEHRADAVVVLRDGSRPVFAVVVEVQLRRAEDKRWTWPVYVAGVRRRLRCPTVLLVVCADADTARWAAFPVELGGPGSRVVPQVLGPDAVPVLTDRDQAARTPELAVLSALVHVSDDGPFAVLDALVAALDHVEVGHAVEYARLVVASLPAIARTHLEALMATETYEYQSEFTRRLEHRGEVRGEARGRAVMVLRILARRSVAVPDEARQRIMSCADLDLLETWGDRAITAVTVEDVFP